MTESNRRFTTDSSPGEQTFESTVSDAVEFIKEMQDNDETTVTFFDPKCVSDSHNKQDEQVSTTDPFGRDFPPYITLGGSRSGVTHSITQDDSLTGGDE
jgi:hypothetical protein